MEPAQKNRERTVESLFSIPENFDFLDYSSWPNWFWRFERFQTAARLDSKNEEYQVNSLVYAIVDQADDILSMLGLSAADLQKYKAVKEALDKDFICKYNAI